jgi:proline iminopeptidase
LYWEVSGNPTGLPAVVLHGGPGAGSSPWHRRLFDPDRYRVVLLDQRGCGRSTPHAADPTVSLRENTTWHLVADLEQLRRHLGIDQWLVVGGSWGSALALGYPEKNPDRVTGLILTGVCTLRQCETEWYWGGGAAPMFPDAWEAFLAPVPISERRLTASLDAYARLLNDLDPQVHLSAADAWNGWDAATFAVESSQTAHRTEPCTPADYAAARLSNHYAVYDGWVTDGQLLSAADRLADIPGVLVQGRYDVQTPLVRAWDLAHAWPRAELVIVDGAGHSPRHPELAGHLVAAIDRFAAPVG